jgi:hypothetical protein
LAVVHIRIQQGKKKSDPDQDFVAQNGTFLQKSVVHVLLVRKKAIKHIYEVGFF